MGKRYRTERRTIDPHEVRTVLHDERAVEYYVKHPTGTFDFWGNGGRPSVGRGRGGQLVAWEGNHRIEAAKRAGRRISVDFQIEIGSADDRKRGWW